ncbi:hypothetical protein B566_EDAN016894 [Ephemera danica]|nr:hypothetical protein B566_EDAN016894 [Ephemera danica]
MEWSWCHLKLRQKRVSAIIGTTPVVLRSIQAGNGAAPISTTIIGQRENPLRQVQLTRPASIIRMDSFMMITPAISFIALFVKIKLHADIKHNK